MRPALTWSAMSSRIGIHRRKKKSRVIGHFVSQLEKRIDIDHFRLVELMIHFVSELEEHTH